MAGNTQSQPISVGGIRADLLFGDPGLPPTAKEGSVEFGAWNPDIKKWEGYSNTTLSNGSAATKFVYENNQTLANLTSQTINNLNDNTKLAYKNNGTFDYRIYSNLDPSAGGSVGGTGIAQETSAVAGPQPQQRASTSSSVLKYPLYESENYDYLKIQHREYLPSGFSGGSVTLPDADSEERRSSIKNTIFLPMQSGISESNSVGWGADQLNALQIAGAGVASNAIKQFGVGNIGGGLSGMANDIVSSIKSMGGDIGESEIINYFAGQAVGANIFTRGTGKVLNPNLELLFSGPNLRTFNYNYRFTPRNDDESREIKKIIKVLKKAMAPKRGNLFLKTPDIFKLEYIYSGGGQHPYMNKIKSCALTGLSVDYTPDGSYMTYQDGSMTSYNVSLQFNELNPIYEEDIDINSNDMGY